MPNKDQTGPKGNGPLTGRGMGVCQGFPLRRFTKTRMGYGMGSGQRRGYRHRFCLAGLLPGCAYLTYRLFNRKKTQK
ncbi:MAG: DUF5320 domain-containing protein [Anaerotignum sp.]|nr:DUF5320 domain-containing protein [Anaerotignum sp.]